jgi:hypothetical protein
MAGWSQWKPRKVSNTLLHLNNMADGTQLLSVAPLNSTSNTPPGAGFGPHAKFRLGGTLKKGTSANATAACRNRPAACTMTPWAVSDSIRSLFCIEASDAHHVTEVPCPTSRSGFCKLQLCFHDFSIAILSFCQLLWNTGVDHRRDALVEANFRPIACLTKFPSIGGLSFSISAACMVISLPSQPGYPKLLACARCGASPFPLMPWVVPASTPARPPFEQPALMGRIDTEQRWEN